MRELGRTSTERPLVITTGPETRQKILLKIMFTLVDPATGMMFHTTELEPILSVRNQHHSRKVIF